MPRPDLWRRSEPSGWPLPQTPQPAYLWGDALEILEASAPAARIVNLETAVSRGGAPWPGKGIHYRVARLEDLSAQTVRRVAGLVSRVRCPHALALVFIRRGGN